MADFVSSILLCFAMLGVISVISIFCSLHDAIVFFRFVSNRQPSQPKVDQLRSKVSGKSSIGEDLYEDEDDIAADSESKDDIVEN